MNFSDIRRKVLKMDSDLSDIKSECLAEMAINGESSLLFEIVNICAEMQSRLTSVKNALEETQVEEQEIAREEWEEEQELLEKYYYEEGIKNVQQD